MNIHEALKVVSKPILNQNKRFKDIHKGETCYIIGNGGSIKRMNLEKFNDHPAITCGFSYVHNDFNKLDVKYYSQIHPFVFSPFIIRNPHTKKLEKNRIGPFMRMGIESFPNIEYFVSLTNYMQIRKKNVNFLFHFGKNEIDLNYIDLSSTFSLMKGSIYSMVGIAMYLGFKKAYFVGMDYSHSGGHGEHFYEKRVNMLDKGIDFQNRDFLSSVSDKIELINITPNGIKSDFIPYINYSEYTGDEEILKDNSEIVDLKNLKLLHCLNWTYRVF